MVLVTPEKIASVMALSPPPHSFAELDDLVAHGLPKGALKASIDRVVKRTKVDTFVLVKLFLLLPHAGAIEEKPFKTMT